ncbi:Protein of unknown function [Lactobacillus delbrueckii subsp. lactis]
MSMKL